MEGEFLGAAVFESEETERAAWFAHRDQFYRSGNIGTRCSGWWKFEADGKDRNGVEGMVYLIESGELDEAERTAGRHIMTCVSRATSNRLILDI